SLPDSSLSGPTCASSAARERSPGSKPTEHWHWKHTDGATLTHLSSSPVSGRTSSSKAPQPVRHPAAGAFLERARAAVVCLHQLGARALGELVHDRLALEPERRRSRWSVLASPCCMAPLASRP